MKLSLFAALSLYQVAADVPDDAFAYGDVKQKCCIALDGGTSRRLELEGKDDTRCHTDDKEDIPGFDCIDSQETCHRRGLVYSPSINLFACGEHEEYCCRKCNPKEPFCFCEDGVCEKVELDTHWSCTMAGYPDGTFFCGFGEACKLLPSGCQGDPHFKGWTGESFDFMGECDLNFLSHPEFNQGLGMNMQLRTTIRNDYSYIESVALEIGGDVLEVGSYGVYFYNGVETADLAGVMMGDQYSIEHTTKDNKHSEFKITIQAEVGETIVISNVKDLVSVLTNNATFVSFGTSQGMMGDFRTGTFSARDGTVMKKSQPDAFAFEWQVRDTEKNLFQTVRAPQYPTQCVMPSKDASAVSRRLGQAGLAPADAEAACAKVQDDKTTFENCVYDVMATGDIDAAATYV